MRGRRAHLSSTLRLACIALASAFLARAPAARATEPTALADVSSNAIAKAKASSAQGAPITAIAVAPATDLVTPAVAYDRWRGLSFGTYLAPKSDFVAQDGGVDVVFHFHAGQMAERQMKESGTNAVFVSCGYGMGSGAYADAFASPLRFGRMLEELVKNLETQTGKKGLHVRHLALASWSAGFAAVGKILGVDRYYAMVDTVILNDSLHSRYKESNARKGTPSQGADHVDLKMIRSFIRFAKDAVDGHKTMAMTHSSIVPPDYAWTEIDLCIRSQS